MNPLISIGILLLLLLISICAGCCFWFMDLRKKNPLWICLILVSAFAVMPIFVLGCIYVYYYSLRPAYINIRRRRSSGYRLYQLPHLDMFQYINVNSDDRSLPNEISPRGDMVAFSGERNSLNHSEIEIGSNLEIHPELLTDTPDLRLRRWFYGLFWGFMHMDRIFPRRMARLESIINMSPQPQTISQFSNASDPAHQNLSVIPYAEPQSSSTNSSDSTGAADNPQILQEHQ